MKSLKQLGTAAAHLGIVYFLIILYLRKIIFSEGLPGSNVNLDFYSYTIVTKAYNDALNQGIIPLGVYWYPKLYGGTPATTYQGGFEILGPILALILNLTNDIATTVKLLIFLSLILACTTSYIYFRQILGENVTLPTVIYTFSYYWLNEILNGHLHLIFGAAIIPLALTFFERIILKTSRRSIIAFGITLSIMILSELQITFFTLMFIVLRLVYFIYTKHVSKKAVLAFISSLAITLMITAPLIIPFIIIYKSARFDVLSFWAAPPYTYFTRIMHKAYGVEPYYYYMGVIPLTITLIHLLRVFNLKTVNNSAGNFIFFLLSGVFFMWYSSVHYAPISIAHVVRALVPFAINIRVVSRSIILASLSIGACTGIACSSIVERLRKHGRVLLKGLPVLLSIIIFIDSTWGIEPMTTPLFNGLEDFNYFRSQEGDFNVVGYPPVWSLSHYISAYINKSILSSNTLFTVYNQQIENVGKLYNAFVKVYSTLYVENGGFEEDIDVYNGWSLNLSGGSRVMRTSLEHREGGFSLHLLIDTSGNVEYIGLSQEIVEKPVVGEGMYLSMSLKPLRMEDTSIRVWIGVVENVTGEFRKIYVCDYKDELNINQWNDIAEDISNRVGRGVWQVVNISIEVYSVGGFEGFLDSISIRYEEGDIPIKLSYYGVKYVYVYKDIEFIRRYVAFGDEEIVKETYSRIRNMIYRLENSKNFEREYSGKRIEIFRNRYFKGFIFPLDDSVDVNYSWIDLNTLKIKVNSKSNTTVIVCQPLHQGWTAASTSGENIEINDFNGVMSLNVKQGVNEVTIHFNRYEESLVRTGLFWITALIAILILNRLRR